MSERVLRAAALFTGSLVVLLSLVGAVIRLIGPAVPQTFNIGSPIDFAAEAASASTYGVLGAVLARRLPRHPVPWIFLGIGLCFAGVVLTWAYGVVALSQGLGPGLPLAREGILLNAGILQPIGLALLVTLLVVFPDGRPFDTTARLILLASPVTAALIAIGIFLTPVGMGIFTGVANPLGISGPGDSGRVVSAAGVIGSVVLGALACRSLLLRYRAADDVQREQIRWFVWAGVLAIVMAGGILVLIAIFPNILNTPAEAIVLVTFSVGAAVVPVACAIAIRRYHLYDIDQLISQTFVYTSLVAIVAGVYAALITGLQQLSVALIGEKSDFSIVITTLVLAVAFEPVKKRLEAYAERFRDNEPQPPKVSEKSSIEDDEIELLADRVAELLSRRQSG